MRKVRLAPHLLLCTHTRTLIPTPHIYLAEKTTNKYSRVWPTFSRFQPKPFSLSLSRRRRRRARAPLYVCVYTTFVHYLFVVFPVTLNHREGTKKKRNTFFFDFWARYKFRSRFWFYGDCTFLCTCYGLGAFACFSSFFILSTLRFASPSPLPPPSPRSRHPSFSLKRALFLLLACSFHKVVGSISPTRSLSLST